MEHPSDWIQLPDLNLWVRAHSVSRLGIRKHPAWDNHLGKAVTKTLSRRRWLFGAKVTEEQPVDPAAHGPQVMICFTQGNDSWIQCKTMAQAEDVVNKIFQDIKLAEDSLR